MTTTAGRMARRAHGNDVVTGAARVGLLARGVVWLLVGALAASLVVGAPGGAAQADQGGALRTLAGSPGGALLLGLLVLGFLAYAAHRALSAAVGERGSDHRTLSRLKAAGEALLYALAALAAARALVGRSPDSEQQTRSATAGLMGLPFGRLLVGAVGAVAVVVAVVLVVRALRHGHADGARTAPPRLRRPLLVLGLAGHVGRSVAIALVGGFLVHAAVRVDLAQAKGLDAALHAVAGRPAGTVLLLLAALSFACYGLWSLVEAAWGQV